MSDKDRISSASFALRRNGELSFLLVLDRAGLVKRMGSSKPDGASADVAVGEQPGLFEALMAAVPEGLLSRAGRYEAEPGEGQRHDWHIEFQGGPEPAIFDLSYDSRSAGLPKAFAKLVATGERLTDAWYAEQTRPEDHAAAVAAAEPGSTADGPTTSEGHSAPPSRAATGGAPRVPVTKKRIAFAVLLDFIVLSVPYALMSLLGGDGLGPPGGGLVLFAFVEFGLLQFARRSPGYWLLGIRAPLGGRGTVDGDQHRREAWWTMFTGYLMLGGGAEGLTAWVAYSEPMPYFGLELGTALSALITVLLASAMVVAGVLILRTDVRGAWVGVGALAFSGLMTLVGWQDWMSWIRGELAAASEAGGRPVSSEELEALTGFMPPVVIAIELFYLVTLGLTWKRLASPGKAA